MCRIKIFILTLLFLFLQTSLKGQQRNYKLTGEVSDSHAQLLEGVTVLIKQGTKTMQYQSTDSLGAFYFSLNLPDTVNTIVIEAKLLGYRAESLVLRLDHPALSVNFILKDQLIELKEVNIDKEKSHISVRGDTTAFNLKGFRQGNEKTIEDIVKKLPGMNVDEGGNITFKGNRIEKVLIEDEDFYKEKYKSLTQNFNQLNIDTIEAIENYLEEDILSGFFKSGKTVLNLKLTKSDGIHASGNLEAGFANGSRYDLSSNAVAWKSKIKFINLAAMNNVSKGITNYVPEVQISDGMNYAIQPVGGSNIFLPLSTLNGNLKGAKTVMNPNFLIRPVQRLSIKGSGGYYRQKEKSMFSSDLNYFEQNAFLSQNSTSKNIASDEALDYELELKYAINKISRLKNTSTFTRTNNVILQTDDIEQMLSSSLNTFTPRSYYKKFSNGIDYLRKNNASTVYNITSSFYIIKTDNTVSNILSQKNGNTDTIGQFSYNKNYISETNLRVLKKIGSDMIMYGIGLSYNLEELDSEFDYLNAIEKNEVSSKLFDYYSNFGFVKTFKTYSLSLRSSVNYFNRVLQFSDEHINVSKVLLNAILKNNYRLSDKSSVSVTFNYENVPAGTNQLYRQYMITGNRVYTRNSPTNATFYKKADVTAFFAYNNLFEKQLSINGFITYGQRPVSANIYGIDLNRTLATTFNSFRKPFFLANLTFSKLLPFIASTLKLEFNHSQSSYLGVINSNVLQTFKNSNSTVTTKLLTGFKGIFNADASFSASVTKLKTKNVPAPPILFQTKVNFYLSFEDLNISGKSNLIYYNKDISSTLLNTELKIDYKPRDARFSFGGTVSNLFNNKKFSQQNRTNLYERMLLYELNSRYFMLNCNYTF